MNVESFSMWVAVAQKLDPKLVLMATRAVFRNSPRTSSLVYGSTSLIWSASVMYLPKGYAMPSPWEPHGILVVDPEYFLRNAQAVEVVFRIGRGLLAAVAP